MLWKLLLAHLGDNFAILDRIFQQKFVLVPFSVFQSMQEYYLKLRYVILYNYNYTLTVFTLRS
jgi:hypothetical protein